MSSNNKSERINMKKKQKKANINRKKFWIMDEIIEEDLNFNSYLSDNVTSLSAIKRELKNYIRECQNLLKNIEKIDTKKWKNIMCYVYDDNNLQINGCRLETNTELEENNSCTQPYCTTCSQNLE